MAETKRRTAPVRLREPQTVPISDEDYRRAVAALAMMIHHWWVNEQSARCETSEALAGTNPDGHS
jgi:hypothetical protein